MKNTMYIDTAGKKCIVGICYESIRRSSKKSRYGIFRYRKSNSMHRTTDHLQV